MNNNAELITYVNEQIRRNEEIHQETLECLEIKKEMYVRQLVQKVVAEYGLPLSGPDFEQLYQACLAWVKSQPPRVTTIVVNEMNF